MAACAIAMTSVSGSAAGLLGEKSSPRLLETVVVKGGNISISASQAELDRVAQKFVKMRKSFSPYASLRFKLSSPGSMLSLSSADASVIVPLDTRNTFDLASLPALSGSYFYSSAKNSAIRPYVRSSENENSLRIGDMRLECELTWELIRPEAPLKVKLYLATHGGWCGTRKIQWTYGVGKRILAAELSSDGNSTPLEISQNGMVAIVPIQDRNIPNSAVIEIETE